MSWDYIPGKNAEGYPDPTAATAIANAERSLRGRQNRDHGQQFEDLIDASLEWYELKGVACVEKTPEPMKPLSKPNKKGQFLACFVKAAQPDYKGTIDGGRSVVFEAKHTDTDRIEQKKVTGEQRDRLELHHAMGAAAFVVVSFGLRDFYRVPWEVWRDMKALFGHKYMNRAEIEPYRIQYIAGVLKMLEGINKHHGKKETP